MIYNNWLWLDPVPVFLGYLSEVGRRSIGRPDEGAVPAHSNNSYFGCEADDRTTMWAFDPRMGFRLRPVFSSDFTHFDVPDFADVIPEAFEMVEKGFVTEQDFREFTFTKGEIGVWLLHLDYLLNAAPMRRDDDFFARLDQI